MRKNKQEEERQEDVKSHIDKDGGKTGRRRGGRSRRMWREGRIGVYL
jgi:hypothetical protein